MVREVCVLCACLLSLSLSFCHTQTKTHTNRCWIKEEYSYLRLLFFYVPLVLILIMNFVLLLKIRTIQKRLGPTRLVVHSNALLYVFVFFFIWIFSIVHRLCQVLSPSWRFAWLAILQAFFTPLHGFANSCVYTLSVSPYAHIDYDSIVDDYDEITRSQYDLKEPLMITEDSLDNNNNKNNNNNEANKQKLDEKSVVSEKNTKGKNTFFVVLAFIVIACSRGFLPLIEEMAGDDFSPVCVCVYVLCMNALLHIVLNQPLHYNYAYTVCYQRFESAHWIIIVRSIDIRLQVREKRERKRKRESERQREREQ